MSSSNNMGHSERNSYYSNSSNPSRRFQRGNRSQGTADRRYDVSYQQQQYYYPDSRYYGGYYNMEYLVPTANYPSDNQWIVNSVGDFQSPYSYHLQTPADTSLPSEVLSSDFVSQFSPEAPEFVMKEAKTAEPRPAEIPEGKKKKKRRKKKKTPVNNVSPLDSKEDGNLVSTSPELSTAVLKQKKTVRFLESGDATAADCGPTDSKEANNFTIEKTELYYSNLFGGKVKELEKNWPQLSGEPSVELQSRKGPTFADKLKNATTRGCTYLDWRDQRTSASNRPPSREFLMQNSPEDSKSQLQASPKIEVTIQQDEDAEWVTVGRKKREKKEEAKLDIEPSQQPQLVAKKLTAEEQLKKDKDKDRKERKKARDKEKKKQVRDEKLLAQKLAPKGQKVTIITPQIMEKFLKSNSSTQSAKTSRSKSTVDTLTFDDSLFPALGQPSRPSRVPPPVSDSESEWETTEVEIVLERSAVNPQTAVRSKNAKRSKHIEWDLLSLIKSQKTKKTPNQPVHGETSNRRIRSKNVGLVANPLDRNAPILVRGKIRNKKRKLSDIRKALVAAKAKKKELLAATADVTAVESQPPKHTPAAPKLHSNKFREYCDQMLTDDIDVMARDMLFHLRHFQDRAFHKDPIKGRMRKRLIAGLREVTKKVERNRVKIIFLAPDIQRCPETGGLDQAIEHLLESARKIDLPIVYALSRRKIGRVLKKNVPVSCCGVLNYQGTEETWNKLSELIVKAKEEYQLKAQQLDPKTTAHPSIREEIKSSESECNVTGNSEAAPETNVLLALMKSNLQVVEQ